MSDPRASIDSQERSGFWSRYIYILSEKKCLCVIILTLSSSKASRTVIFCYVVFSRLSAVLTHGTSDGLVSWTMIVYCPILSFRPGKASSAPVCSLDGIDIFHLITALRFSFVAAIRYGSPYAARISMLDGIPRLLLYLFHVLHAHDRLTSHLSSHTPLLSLNLEQGSCV